MWFLIPEDLKNDLLAYKDKRLLLRARSLPNARDPGDEVEKFIHSTQ